MEADGDYEQLGEESTKSITSDADKDETSEMNQDQPIGNVTQGDSKWDADPKPEEHEANATQGTANERLYGADSSSKSLMIPKVEIAVATEELLEQTMLDEGTKEVVMTLAEQGWSNNDIINWLLTCEEKTQGRLWMIRNKG